MLKKLIIIIFCLTSLTTAQRKAFLIAPNNDGGHDINNLKGEIQLEFTARNRDSLSLSMLEEIYTNAAEARLYLPSSTLTYSMLMLGIMIGFLIHHALGRGKPMNKNINPSPPTS